MNRKILFLATATAIVLATGWNVSRNMNEKALSDVALANVEALAGEINSECPNGCLAQCGSGCYCYRWYELYQEATWN
jgi:hypothetical protein